MGGISVGGSQVQPIGVGGTSILNIGGYNC